MKFKSKFLLILIVTFLISMSFVSASDMDITAQNITSDNTLGNDDDFEEYIYNFDDFVNEANSGLSEIELDTDYVDTEDWSDYESRGVESWWIEESVTIDGKGHSLDWNGSPNSISIEANNVVLKNMIFKNFNNASDYTNAIDWAGNGGLIENCTFIGNTFDIGLFNVYGNNLVIKNCKFENNNGGTLLWINSEKGATLTNCEFYNNVVGKSGNGFICWQSEKGVISDNKFKNNIYSNDWTDLAGQICFNPFSCDSNAVIKNNIFLNSGMLLNNGNYIDRKDFRYGESYKILVIDEMGNPVKSNEEVTVKFIISIYGGKHYDDDGLVDDLIKNVTLDYTLKTDNAGYIQLNINDIISDFRLENQNITLKFNGHGSYSWGEFLRNDGSEGEVSSTLFRFEYKNYCYVLDSTISSSLVMIKVDDWWYAFNVGQLKVTEYGNYANYNLVFCFSDFNGNDLKNKEVSIKIGDKLYSSKTNSYGWASINANLKYGVYEVNVTNPITNQVLTDSFKVSKIFSYNKNIVKYYKSSTAYKIRVVVDGQIVKRDYVTFTINKGVYKIRTDSNGYATLPLNQKPGKYTVIAQYMGHIVSNKITIKTTIVTKNVVKKSKKTGKFTVKILNSKGKAYAKKIVKIKFKGKTYNLKTNSKGIVTLKFSNSLKIGKYAIKTTYNGLTVKNTLTVKK